MGAVSEPLSHEKDSPSRGVELVARQTCTSHTGGALNSHVDALLAGVSENPPESEAGSFSAHRLAAPVLQRAQQLYGNRASQQIVMRVRPVQRHCSCGGECPKCKEEDEQRSLQRSSSAVSSPAFDGVPSTHGDLLAPATRAPLEAHFDADLSDVRVHSDFEADRSARQMDALAYATGRDIYFAAGMYAPSTDSGRRLLAHEVAHVVQQSSGREPTIATSSAHGVKIGAPDDSLEREAELEAEQFVTGSTNEGDEHRKRESANQLSNVTQRCVQRQEANPVPSQSVAAPPPTPAAASSQNQPLISSDEVIKTLDGVQLAPDPIFMRFQLEQLEARGGDSWAFLDRLERDYNTDEMAGDRAFKKQYEAAEGHVSAGVPRAQEDFDAYDQMKAKELPILQIVHTVVEQLNAEHDRFIWSFEGAAKAKAFDVLLENERQGEAEALRYGIVWKTAEYMRSDCLFGDCKYSKTTYSMGDKSPAVTGLQGAANVLLGRRKSLDDARDKSARAHDDYLNNVARCAGEGGGSFDTDYSICPGNEDVSQRRTDADQELKKQSDKYELIRGFLAEQYPILSVFSDPEKSTGDLERLAKGQAEPGMAEFLGKEIKERFDNITKVRDGLGDSKEVNVWLLPELVGTTSAALGLESDPLRKRWVENKVRSEQPGILESIALAVLNITALILAGPTGGLSLAVAAGVNAVVAAQHIKEYQMQKALAGTAFDKANALSREDPSFFWLAVEVVGVAMDAAAAFKAIASAVKVAKAAQEAGDVVLIARAKNSLEDVAKLHGGEELAARVIAHLGEDAGTEGKALKALGLTEGEKNLLQSGTQLAEKELEAGVIGGEAAAKLPVKISRGGRIFSCHSPCEWMVEKYSEILGPEIEMEGGKTFRAEYLALEERATKAAEAVRTATGENVTKAQEMAAALEGEISAFDQKLAKELAHTQAMKKLAAIDPSSAAKFAQLDKDAAIRMAELDADTLGRLSRLEGDALAKFADLPKTFPKLKDLDLPALERVLAKAPNEGHIKGQLLEELLNSRMTQPGEIASHVPANIAKELEKQGAKLEFIPGHAILDADGEMISDGLIGYWKDDKFNVVTFFESKAGRASGRGLRRSWTGTPKAERAELLKEAQTSGLEAMRETDQNAAEALSEAASAVRKTKKTGGMSLDDLLKKYPEDVQREWAKLPQGEAGQIRKTTERLSGSLKIYGQDVEIATSGTPHAVGVLPSDVLEKTLETTMKEGGIKSFQRMKDVSVTQDELNSMAKAIADLSGTTKPVP